MGHSSLAKCQVGATKRSLFPCPLLRTRALAAKLGFHEAIEIALQNCFHVARFVVRAVLFHQLVGRLHVTANLRAPGIVATSAAQHIHLGLALYATLFGQFRHQNLHSPGPVLMLTAFILTTHYDARGKVGDAYRRVGGIDVLSPGARRAKGVDAKILLVDLYLTRVFVEQWGDVDAGEAGLTTGL